MRPSLHRLEFDGALLVRGFWLYIWEITAKDGEKVHYVGRTGDSSSRNAQSPFARLSQHLGRNERANAVRRNLVEHKLAAEECQAFRLFAYGPIFPEGRSAGRHRSSRDIVAALEKRLADSMHRAGYVMLNEVKCLKHPDGRLWLSVLAAFSKHFPFLQNRASLKEP
jgi:hypothetical protein